MIAVLVVPLAVLVVACLLERLEARVAPTVVTRRAPRRLTGGDAATPTVAEPARRGHLRALAPVPGDAAADTAADTATDTADDAAVDARAWSHAS